jgi:type IV secretion system protein VirD4
MATQKQPPKEKPIGSQRDFEMPERVVGSSAPDAIELGLFHDPELNAATAPLRYGGETSALMVGSSGTGKGMRLLVPNLLRMSGRSIVVIDPKGELAAITAPYRKKLGDVFVINPFDVVCKDFEGYEDLKSGGFNPLATLNPASRSFNAEAGLLGDALIADDGGEAHWAESARALMSALIMYEVIEARQARRVPSMRKVRKHLCMASADGNEGKPSDLIGLPELMLKLCDSPIAGLANKASQFTTWSREVQSIASTAKRQTEPFDDDELATDLERAGFDFGAIKAKPTTVYITLPPEMISRHSRWLRLVISAALQAVLRPRREGEPRVLFILDEFYALGRLRIVETVWNLVRGYGVQFLPILQNLPQLQQVYGDKGADVFLSAAGALSFLTANDMATASWVSRRAGQRTVKVSSFNQGQSVSATGASQSAGAGVSEIGVPLVREQDVLGMSAGKAVNFFAGGADLVRSEAPFYWETPYKDRARANPYFQKRKK